MAAVLAPAVAAAVLLLSFEPASQGEGAEREGGSWLTLQLLP